MKITLNGSQKDIAATTNLKILVEQFCKDSRHVIAELNGTIMKNQQWAEATLKDGDTLELVNFVGGG